jgi:bifunctional DNA-binding transcriptional regulator/antitoxin component of YhaV-PrlF toxin-antitoxin module
MAIYRVMYYSTVTVGSGGRITIPQEMRDDLEPAREQ